MTNIYVLDGQANETFNDSSAIIGTDYDFVLVECSLDEASQLAREWGLAKPMLAKDGKWIFASGDELLIANGERVTSIDDVADALDWPGFDECGLDALDYLYTINRVF